MASQGSLCSFCQMFGATVEQAYLMRRNVDQSRFIVVTNMSGIYVVILCGKPHASRSQVPHSTQAASGTSETSSCKSRRCIVVTVSSRSSPEVVLHGIPDGVFFFFHRRCHSACGWILRPSMTPVDKCVDLLSDQLVLLRFLLKAKHPNFEMLHRTNSRRSPVPVLQTTLCACCVVHDSFGARRTSSSPKASFDINIHFLRN